MWCGYIRIYRRKYVDSSKFVYDILCGFRVYFSEVCMISRKDFLFTSMLSDKDKALAFDLAKKAADVIADKAVANNVDANIHVMMAAVFEIAHIAASELIATRSRRTLLIP